ncbi:MAG: LytR C-terminal domain-containing protein [Microcella sp.]|nr:LytR C-terminal domain-containing protein [Microcella sp.]
MAEFDPDRFDEIPAGLGRVGAHRAPRPKGGIAIAVAWAALASGVLVVAGLWALSLITDQVTFEIPGFDTAEPMPTPTDTPSPPPTVDPITDPALAELPAGFTITVLNGAGVDGLGDTARDLLATPGWPVGTVTSAGQDDLTETVVFYSDPALEGVALGMAVLLGVGETELSDAFPGAPITITLGTDFAAIAP